MEKIINDAEATKIEFERVYANWIDHQVKLKKSACQKIIKFGTK